MEPRLRALLEVWLRVEAGQLDRAAALATDLSEQAERHGLDQWRLVGATRQAAVGGLVALDADDVDPTDLAAHIATMTTLLDLAYGRAEPLPHLFDAVLGRLLIAAGQPEAARERLDTGLQLAQDTGMHFYDAELCGCAPTPTTTQTARRADSTPHSPSRAARARPFSNCALHSMTTNYAANPRALLLTRRRQPHADRQPMPEVAQARSAMKLNDFE